MSPQSSPSFSRLCFLARRTRRPWKFCLSNKEALEAIDGYEQYITVKCNNQVQIDRRQHITALLIYFSKNPKAFYF
jgi:hypothetical protein